VIDAVMTASAAAGAQTGGVRTISCDGRCFVAYEAIADRPGAMLAVVVEAAETSAAIRAVSRTIVLAALASLAALVLVSQLMARRVTAPLDKLVGFTHDVAGGGHGRAAEGGDEVGRLGRAFNEMLDRLEASKSALVRSEKLGLAGLFAARVAHDIRNPLASMKINAQLLDRALKADPANAGLVNAMLHDISQVESVIRDLIELARPGELRLVPADLNVVVRNVVRQLEARLTHRKVAAALALQDRLPRVMTDTERFSQALQNIIVNAIDAMPNGGALTITSRSDDGQVIIDVDDEGVGIDPDLAGRLFDPFVSSKPEGVGLGLVNAKAVVEGHGGQIALTPRQPRGTRARITVPAS
jgi:signal transduction histidine kinase